MRLLVSVGYRKSEWRDLLPTVLFYSAVVAVCSPETKNLPAIRVLNNRIRNYLIHIFVLLVESLAILLLNLNGRSYRVLFLTMLPEKEI